MFEREKHIAVLGEDGVERHVVLCAGDLVPPPAAEAVDLLVVSALPGDYTPTPSSVIGQLSEIGVHVSQLANNKSADLRETTGAWLSAPVAHPSFDRLVCFEPHRLGDPPDVVGKLFRALFPFLDEDREYEVAMPLLSTGDAGLRPEEMAYPLVEAAVGWLELGLPIKTLMIVARPGPDLGALRKAFIRYDRSNTEAYLKELSDTSNQEVAFSVEDPPNPVERQRTQAAAPPQPGPAPKPAAWPAWLGVGGIAAVLAALLYGVLAGLRAPPPPPIYVPPDDTTNPGDGGQQPLSEPQVPFPEPVPIAAPPSVPLEALLMIAVLGGFALLLVLWARWRGGALRGAVAGFMAAPVAVLALMISVGTLLPVLLPERVPVAAGGFEMLILLLLLGAGGVGAAIGASWGRRRDRRPETPAAAPTRAPIEVTAPEAPRLFLSFSSIDAFAADRIVARFEARAPHLEVFDFRRDIPLGTSYQRRIDAALKRSTRMICLISPDYLASGECEEELMVGRLRNKRQDFEFLVPIYWRQVQGELEDWIMVLNLADCRESDEADLDHAVDRVIAAL